MSNSNPNLSEGLLLRVCFILVIALGISLTATLIALRAASVNKTSVIATDANRTVVPVVPLDKPVVNEPRIVGFAQECVRSAFSHDFLHHDDTMKLAQKCFALDGADTYAELMDGYFKQMDDKRMNMSIVIRRPAQVTRRWVDEQNTANWDLETEVDISFEGRNESVPPSRYRMDLTIKRIPLRESPRGLAISRLRLSPAT